MSELRDSPSWPSDDTLSEFFEEGLQKRVDFIRTMISKADPDVIERLFPQVVDSALAEADGQPGASHHDPHVRNAITDTAAKALQIKALESGGEK